MTGFRRSHFRYLVPIVAVVACIALAVAFAPRLIWAFHFQRAGGELATALAWPEPRLADSLPTLVDAAAAARAEAQLDVAKAWLPNNAEAYRSSGRIFLARGDWVRAAAEFEQARQHAPAEPLIAWEAALAYEQMDLAASAAPSVLQFETFAVGQLRAPGQLIRSTFCREGGAETCYFGRTSYTQPNIDFSDGPSVARDVLFLHPPASLTASLLVPAETPMLRFAIGLDPAARDWQSDGATFRIRAGSAGAQQIVSEVHISAETARQGWVRGVANLQPWAGQTIEITLESDPGPQGDSSDDWFAWGDLALTTPEAAVFLAQNPTSRMVKSWLAAGQGTSLFTRYRDQAAQAGDANTAAAWERRLQVLTPQ